MKRFALIPFALLLTATLAHAKFEMKNFEMSYGDYGPPRYSPCYYPGHDALCVRYRLERDEAENGSCPVDYSLALLDPEGKTVLLSRQTLQGDEWMSGKSVYVTQGLDLNASFSPGTYTVVVTAKNRVSSEMATIKRTVQMKAEELAVTGVTLSYDKEGKFPASLTCAVGQTLWFNVKVINVLLDQKGQVNCGGNLAVVDADTKEVVWNLGDRDFNDRSPTPGTKTDELHIVGYLSTLRRPGDFLIRVALTDNFAKKSLNFEMPLHIVQP
jgi:hypothetical protein